MLLLLSKERRHSWETARDKWEEGVGDGRQLESWSVRFKWSYISIIYIPKTIIPEDKIRKLFKEVKIETKTLRRFLQKF